MVHYYYFTYSLFYAPAAVGLQNSDIRIELPRANSEVGELAFRGRLAETVDLHKHSNNELSVS